MTERLGSLADSQCFECAVMVCVLERRVGGIESWGGVKGIGVQRTEGL